MKKAEIILLMLPMAATLAWADMPSMEKGKELFNSTTLGSNGKSCSTCHMDGKKLDRAANYDEGELGEIINQCIKNSLGGKALDPSSSEMKSLIMFVKSFAGPGKH